MAERTARKSNSNADSRSSTHCDDIKPVGESRADVRTGNEEEESLEEGIRTFEVTQKNPTSREEPELENCGHSVNKTWRGARVKDRCTRKRLHIEPLEKGRKRTEPSWDPFDGILLCCADTTLECENGPSREVFQEVSLFLFKWLGEPHMTFRCSIGFLISEGDS